MYATGFCIGCNNLFTFNPERVPSIRIRRDRLGNLVHDPEGNREPICRSCVEAANPVRIAKGLLPIEILSGAYDPAPDGFDLEDEE